MNRLKKAKSEGAKPPSTFPRTREIAVIADIHASPDEDLRDAIIDANPDYIVIAGDFTDSQQLSAHKEQPKRQQQLFLSEIDICRNYLKYFLKKLPNVQIKLMGGNHDNWLTRLMQESLPDDVISALPDTLSLIANGLDRVETVRSTLSIQQPGKASRPSNNSPYLYILGDAIISHMNFVGKKPGDAVNKLHTWLSEWRRVLGLPDYSLLIQAHTHKTYLSKIQGGYVTLVEPGVAGYPIDGYKLSYEGKWTPSPVGGIIFNQHYTDRDGWLVSRHTMRLL